MAAKILPKSPPGESKKKPKLSPAAAAVEDKRQAELVDQLDDLKRELDDVQGTLKGISRTSILLEKLSGSREALYQAVNAHSSLIDSTVDWIEDLTEKLEDIAKLPAHLANCARSLHCMHDCDTDLRRCCWCAILKRKKHGQPLTQSNDAAHGRRRPAAAAERGGSL